MKNTRIVQWLAAGLLLAAPAAGLAQTGPDNLWEISSVMMMEGMRMPGPPTRVCAKAAQSDNLMPVQQDCRITDRSTSGNRTTYRVVCTGKEPMTGTGEIVLGQGSYQGVLRLTGKSDGETINMTTEYSGRLVGKCTAK